MRTWKIVSQQYTAWSGCMDVQAGQALYLRQRLKHFQFQQGNGNQMTYYHRMFSCT